MDILKECRLCPRNCGVNRYENIGFCGAGDQIEVAYYSLHEWEEPIISGSNGSGTIFFSHCNLKCLFCQNEKISHLGYGKKISEQRLMEICLELQNKGAHNINLVTPTHYVPQIVHLLQKTKDNSLKIPIVYNTSSYENKETIRLLDGLIDIYLADFKYYDNILGEKYSHCSNYFEVASAAVDEMFAQVGKFVLEDGIMKRGMIVRVLILPGHVEDAKKIISYLYKKYGDQIFISIMNQYTPMKHNFSFTNLNRSVSKEEYDRVISYALDLGITYAFIQDGETAVESFIPNFDTNVV